MPAASTKPDKASFEANDPIKQVIQVVEKKVRNLEKRKGKLDGYKAKADTGATLEKDQQAAIDKYEEVMQTLEFARDLQKQFQGISVDAEKMMKKQAKREKIDRQNMVLKRIQELLKIQNLLDSMGSEKVRSDFQTGKHGAVVLTEENLNHLDELYKLISPSRDEADNYVEQLAVASDHILALIDAREKEVVGTTYKDLKELLDLISDCGYFENAAAQEEETTEEAATDPEYKVVSSNEVAQADSTEVQASLPQQVIDEQSEHTNESSQSNVQQQAEYATMAEADSFFSKATTASSSEVGTATATTSQQQQQAQEDDAYNQRAFQEIVSSVQGNFNFLQESTIDMESPHMDPAVVAAHPMPPAPLGHQTESLSSQTFSNQGFGDLSQQVSHDPTASNAESTQSLLSQQQSSLGGASEYSSQTFGQSALSQTLQTEPLFASSAVKDTSSQLPQNVMGQTSDSTISQFEIPPSLPMPPGIKANVQESSSSESQAEKKFTMNPNAEMFQSQLYNASAPQDEFGQQQGDFGRQNYQGSNYNNSTYRGSRGGGGFRGKGNRGADRNMSNGFSGGRGGRGGNSYNSNSGSQRGGFQGFPPRSDYNRSEGYQNYNGNFGGNNSGGGFQKRGGGQPRGNNRGGAMRGGAPRGASRGGPGRGGNTGGFGRPPQQQTA